MNDQLKQIYYNPEDPGAYGGVERLLRRAKQLGLNVSRDQVKEFLTDQQTYSLHKPARKRFRRNKTYVTGIDKQWQADLAEMQPWARVNKGYRYILTVVDCFSRYAWAIPIKSKSSKSMVPAFVKLFKLTKPHKPVKLQTDKGTEFKNKDVQKLFRENNIIHFSSNSDQKAALVEIFNKTLKSRIWRYFTDKQTRKWYSVLGSFLNGYNNSYHKTIKMAPSEVNKDNENQVWINIYGDGGIADVSTRVIPPASMVRISKVKGEFQKGYLPNWSEEHFNIDETRGAQKRIYKLVDTTGEEVKGSWYKEELQPIKKNRYLVEKVIRKRKNPQTQVEEAFVKWKGWPASRNTWVPLTDLTRNLEDVR